MEHRVWANAPAGKTPTHSTDQTPASNVSVSDLVPHAQGNWWKRTMWHSSTSSFCIFVPHREPTDSQPCQQDFVNGTSFLSQVWTQREADSALLQTV